MKPGTFAANCVLARRLDIRASRQIAVIGQDADEFPISDDSVNPDRPQVGLAGDGSSFIVTWQADDGDGRGVFAHWMPFD